MQWAESWLPFMELKTQERGRVVADEKARRLEGALQSRAVQGRHEARKSSPAASRTFKRRNLQVHDVGIDDEKDGRWGEGVASIKSTK
jgi:hypothetical protein